MLILSPHFAFLLMRWGWAGDEIEGEEEGEEHALGAGAGRKRCGGGAVREYMDAGDIGDGDDGNDDADAIRVFKKRAVHELIEARELVSLFLFLLLSSRLLPLLLVSLHDVTAAHARAGLLVPPL